jgi:phosphoglycerate-specific signal transduction histidine kinase
MQHLNNDQKAKIYNDLLFKYQRLQEEVRKIKAGNFDLSENEQRKVNELEAQMRSIFQQTERLYH